jgi:hypothetical protein
MEKILCAAIWYKEQPTAKILPTNVDKGVVVCGHRHPHCIHTFVALTGKRSVLTECGDYTQGFLTDINRFVDRSEGLRIAINADQLLQAPGLGKSILFSEDIY